MKRTGRLAVFLPLLLASCTTLDGYLPWMKKGVSASQQLVTRSVEATITRATPADPEYAQDEWAFVLVARNKTSEVLSVEYKVVFMDKAGDPTDVQYGTIDFPAGWPEHRRAVIPEAESVKARVVLYLLDAPRATPAPVATTLGGGIGGSIGGGPTPTPQPYPLSTTPTPLPSPS